MTRELVDALIDGDSIAIENTFNSAISQKVSAALDDYRVQVAQNMFNHSEEDLTVDDNVQDT
jgi:hypothetical protein